VRIGFEIRWERLEEHLLLTWRIWDVGRHCGCTTGLGRLQLDHLVPIRDTLILFDNGSVCLGKITLDHGHGPTTSWKLGLGFLTVLIIAEKFCLKLGLDCVRRSALPSWWIWELGLLNRRNMKLGQMMLDQRVTVRWNAVDVRREHAHVEPLGHNCWKCN
jgi:hypothetical protein